MPLNAKSVLITGGTGSFGKRMAATILERYDVHKLVIFSRDELKQFEMANSSPFVGNEKIQYYIGDIRELERLRTALRGVDVIIHAAALKQVPSCEYNPFEAIKTNVLGGQNLITAAIECGVKKVVALSTDKAAAPINLYGATKLCSDKLFIAGNAMSGFAATRFSVVRYGNVVGSRGSVMPYFLNLIKNGKPITITDRRMTRFSITLQEGVDFVLDCLQSMHGGELFVPKLPSYRITDVAEAVAPGQPMEEIGIRPGEKLHEVMITTDDARNTVDCGEYFIIKPAMDWWKISDLIAGKPCPEDFAYSSGNNDTWLNVDEVRALISSECGGAQLS